MKGVQIMEETRLRSWAEGLKDLQDLVKKEQEAETDLRGGAEIGMLD